MASDREKKGKSKTRWWESTHCVNVRIYDPRSHSEVFHIYLDLVVVLENPCVASKNEKDKDISTASTPSSVLGNFVSWNDQEMFPGASISE